MLPVYFLALSLTILDLSPKAAAQNKDYLTHIHYALTLRNAYPELTVIATADGNTNIFRPYSDSQEIQSALVTDDFFDYEKSTESVDHLTGEDVFSCFAVFDPNTTGLASDYIMGALNEDDGSAIVAILSDSGTTKIYCDEDCFNGYLSGHTSTSWDPERKRWVTLAEPSDGDCFATSPDLRDWTYQFWDLENPLIGPYESILEMFPIADLDDPSQIVWVLIRNSIPFGSGPVSLLWDTFVPDDEDRQYEQMGVLDASPYVVEYALVNDNSTDYLRRKIIFVQRADYEANGIYYNTYITGRELTYKDGKLRQMPISTAYGPPTDHLTFPTIAYEVNKPVLSSVPGSVVFKIEAELEIIAEDCGFYFFIDPDDGDFCAVSFTISGESQSITLSRLEWFAPGSKPRDPYEDISNDITLPTGGNVQVLIVVDYCIIEYFVLDGLYAGSIIAFPDLSWDQHEFFSEAPMTITNLTFTTYDL